MGGSKMGIVVWDAVGNSCGSESRLVVFRIKVPSRAASHTLLLASPFPFKSSQRSWLLLFLRMNELQVSF